eukprot:m.104428 g.104428  ORF g.104428 m.104428 type:complete len:335 (-) comp16845_c0_seq3:39-1043(-)
MYAGKEQSGMLQDPLMPVHAAPYGGGLSVQVDPMDTYADDDDINSNSECEEDEYDTSQRTSEAADWRHRVSAYYLGINSRFGIEFDPDKPVYRMWTNIRGHRVQLFLAIGWILSLVSLLKGQDEGSIWNLFSAHIVLMATSWSLVSGGIVAYRAGRLRSGNVAELRMYHASVMFFATVCIFCGLVAIIAHKTEEKHKLVPHTSHAILGTISIVAILFQVRIGFIKKGKLERRQGKVHKWHGNAGQCIYAMLVATVVLGFYELKYTSNTTIWLFFTGITVTILTVIAALFQPTSLGADQADQVTPSREVGDSDVEMLVTSFADPPPPLRFAQRHD